MYVHTQIILTFLFGGGTRVDCLILVCSSSFFLVIFFLLRELLLILGGVQFGEWLCEFFYILRTVIVLRWSTAWRVAL